MGLGVSFKRPIIHLVSQPNALTRREAARLIGAGTAGLLFPIGASRAQARSESSGILLRSIPSSGEKLPVIGLGSATTFDVGPGSPQLKPLGEVLSLFVKHGGKLIDSSPMYGRAEGVIGDLTAKLHLRDSLFIATKVWTKSQQDGIAMMQRSVDRFQTRKIDLMQVHNLVGIDEQMGSLREWKSKGRIRYTGITHSEARGFGEVEKAMRTWKPDFVQINYSLVERGAAARILPLAQELRIAVIINRPFGGGGVLDVIAEKPLPAWAAEFDCRSWPQFLLKWIVAHPAVTCVIPATNNPQHLEDNMAAGVGRLPDAKTRQRMASLFVGF
ncbi:MAG: aldo/keto reductase [Spartobacteria bacterium]|nr:aldo/keto reductase [Spartobacteria bacterium]